MKKLTQKQQQMITNYKYARYSSIDECYNNASCFKYRAEQQIKNEMFNKSGYDYRVCGFNCNFFTCAYRYKDENGVEYLVYHTAWNRYEIELQGGEF